MGGEAVPCALGHWGGFSALSWGIRAVVMGRVTIWRGFSSSLGKRGAMGTGHVPGQGVESSLTGKKRKKKGFSSMPFYGQVTLRVKALSVSKKLCFVLHPTPPAGTFLSSQHHQGWRSIAGLCTHKSMCYQSKRRFIGRARGAPCQKPGRGITSHSLFLFLSLFWDGQ